MNSKLRSAIADATAESLAAELASRSGYDLADCLAWVKAREFKKWTDVPQFWNGPLRAFIDARKNESRTSDF